MRELIGVILLAMGMSIAQAQSGAIPADQQTKIRTAMASAKTAQMAAIQAGQQAGVANAQVGNVIHLVQATLELDNTWDFNPNYFDAKSSDFHILKFVQRPAGAPAPGQPTGPQVGSFQHPRGQQASPPTPRGPAFSGNPFPAAHPAPAASVPLGQAPATAHTLPLDQTPAAPAPK